jgi:hypothetical protein
MEILQKPLKPFGISFLVPLAKRPHFTCPNVHKDKRGLASLAFLVPLIKRPHFTQYKLMFMYLEYIINFIKTKLWCNKIQDSPQTQCKEKNTRKETNTIDHLTSLPKSVIPPLSNPIP